MSRYDPPDPKCRHYPKGVVTAGNLMEIRASVSVSVLVCDRQECIDDAKEWAEAVTGRPAVFVADADRGGET